MSVPLVIIDPALGEAEGHHAGFAAMLAASRPKNQRVALWGHRKMSSRLVQSLTDSGIQVRLGFSTHYYRHFSKPGNAAIFIDYVMELAREFAEVHRELNSTGTAYCALYHTLSWEHANALALALQANPAPPTIEHRVLLMFNPGIDHRGHTSDILLRLNYRIALNKLRQLPGVGLYAGCGELARSYSTLLELDEPLPIHPCLVNDWRRRPVPRSMSRSVKPQRILLYIGDAKVDKGFDRLPAVIESLQKQCGAQTHFIVQYNRLPSWANKTLFETELELIQLTAVEPRLTIECAFWSDERLQQEFALADLLLLNYDEKEYAQKSSGVLWMAAWHKLPTLVPQGWLKREATRIGLPHASCDALHNLNTIDLAINDFRPDEAYIDVLFKSIWDWIEPT